MKIKARLTARTKGFFIKHEKLFAIVGALIVFVAFFTREAVRDNLKETSTALEQAMFAYQMQSQFGLLQRQLDQLSEQIDDPASTRLGAHNQKLESLINETVAVLNSTDKMIGDSEDLLNRLPTRSQTLHIQSAQLQTALAAAQQINEELRQAEGDLVLSDTMNELRDQHKEDVANVREVALRLEDKVFPLQEAAFKLQHAVISEAERQKEHQQKRYHRATTGMYMLFAFGWLLGLLGKILNLQSFGSSEGA